MRVMPPFLLLFPLSLAAAVLGALGCLSVEACSEGSGLRATLLPLHFSSPYSQLRLTTSCAHPKPCLSPTSTPSLCPSSGPSSPTACLPASLPAAHSLAAAVASHLAGSGGAGVSAPSPPGHSPSIQPTLPMSPPHMPSMGPTPSPGSPGLLGGAGNTGGSIPDQLLCPLSGAVMIDPVVAADGVTYERQAISDWLAVR